MMLAGVSLSTFQNLGVKLPQEGSNSTLLSKMGRIFKEGWKHLMSQIAGTPLANRANKILINEESQALAISYLNDLKKLPENQKIEFLKKVQGFLDNYGNVGSPLTTELRNGVNFLKLPLEKQAQAHIQNLNKGVASKEEIDAARAFLESIEGIELQNGHYLQKLTETVRPETEEESFLRSALKLVAKGNKVAVEQVDKLLQATRAELEKESIFSPRFPRLTARVALLEKALVPN